MEPKYLVVPDFIKSRGGMAYVTASQLIGLYGVDPLQYCLACYPEDTDRYSPEQLAAMLVLTPRPQGDYQNHLINLEDAHAKK